MGSFEAVLLLSINSVPRRSKSLQLLRRNVVTQNRKQIDTDLGIMQTR